MPDAENAWAVSYYGQLVGATCTGFRFKQDEYTSWIQWPVFTFEKDDAHFEIELSQDEEGNGPGFLFGLPRPE